MPYYTNPTQVRFFTHEGEQYGIAFQDYIIRGDGAIFRIKEVVQDKNPDDVIVELAWVDLTNAIKF